MKQSHSRPRTALAAMLALGVAAVATLGLKAATTLVSASGAPVLRSVDLRDNFEQADLGLWLFPHPEDWAILSEGTNHYLHMVRAGEPGVPRRPLQFALLKGVNVGSFEFSTRLRREKRSLIVVFNYVDTLHFYYAHLSRDRGTEQPVHNGIFIVNGEPRQRIAGLDALPALPDEQWHRVRVVRNARSGSIQLFMDDQSQPLFALTDSTFTCGQVGIGSFDETGDFDDVELKSDDAGCTPGALFRPAKSQETGHGR